ncbi:MAG: hypothetical protein KGZ25_08905 [Planctomycetes bacterium]|nr:hypothetical protein [Planctomycetota bacterium]
MDDQVFFTFDFDWASDEVLSFTLEVLEESGVDQATFFVTHKTPLLSNIRDAGYELGIHPNMLSILRSKEERSPRQLVEDLKEIVPTATSVRSHGLVRSSSLSSLYRDMGFTHECNSLIPVCNNITTKPYEFPTGLLHIPHCWGDSWQLSADKWFSPDKLLRREGLNVLLFHPIHLFINTHSESHYQKAKQNTGNHAKLATHVNHKHFGIRDYLRNCAKTVQEKGLEMGRVCDIVPSKRNETTNGDRSPFV